VAVVGIVVILAVASAIAVAFHLLAPTPPGLAWSDRSKQRMGGLLFTLTCKISFLLKDFLVLKRLCLIYKIL
jgi:hypothetical protein